MCNISLEGVSISEAGPSDALNPGERPKAVDPEAARTKTERLAAQTLEYLGEGQCQSQAYFIQG